MLELKKNLRKIFNFEPRLAGKDRLEVGGVSLDETGNWSDILQLITEIESASPGRVESMLTLLRNGLSPTAKEIDRYNAAEALSMAVYPKYKFSEFARIFLEDELFIQYYERFMDVNNWHSLDRKYTLKQLLNLTLHLEADVAECGAYKGASAYLMCQAHLETGRTVHLFDSFEGLSNPGSKDGDYWFEGALSVPESALHEALSGFSNYSTYKGWIPERFHEVENRGFGFVHIDVDLYQPTLASLTFFYQRLLPGGVILMDDYGFKSCPGAKQAADEFFYDLPERIVNLPTGQAFIVKQP